MSLDIGSALRMVREAKNMKLSELASLANVSTPYLTMVEQGKRQPSLDVLGKLAEQLRVPVDSLLLAAQNNGGSIRSYDSKARRIGASLKKLKLMQDALRRELESQNAESSEDQVGYPS